jgi:RNA polymerase sigma factor (sigma-70 family)
MQMPFDAGDLSDDALLAAYGRGEVRAARLLADRLLPLVWRTARRLLGDAAEAEDVAQEAMLRLWRIAPQWRPGEAKVTTWLYRVTVNLCTDRLRKSSRGVALDAVAEPEDDAPGVVAGLIAADRAAALETALMALPERQRQAVVLRHLEGLANPEIAEIMGIGLEAVESLTARGKRALAARLAGQREDLGYDDA